MSALSITYPGRLEESRMRAASGAGARQGGGMGTLAASGRPSGPRSIQGSSDLNGRVGDWTVPLRVPVPGP